MKGTVRYLRYALPAAGMLCLILDSKTAIAGAQDALNLCLGTLIPSLLPFFVLSILLTNRLSGRSLPLLRPLGKLCAIPEGAESILAIGLLGGYPVGAQCICQAYRAGDLSQASAKRMLGFCSNAGPAFIFGIAGSLFAGPLTPWILWLVHILSAILVGMILPRREAERVRISSTANLSLSDALMRSVSILAGVCGWIILFRVCIAFLQRWFLWLLPGPAQVTVIGVFELANGICSLGEIHTESLRFILCACFLSFGGICVAMQTVTITRDLGTGMYFPGKLLQLVLTFFLAAAVVYCRENGLFYILSSSVLIFFAVILRKKKKTVAIPAKLVYNEKKSC